MYSKILGGLPTYRFPYIRAILDTFNPKMKFVTTKRLPKGDPVCEWIFRIEGCAVEE
ncbi:MAG: hypothetical protein ACXQTD_02045 [Candidatus Syntropharchaeia archaeon]